MTTTLERMIEALREAAQTDIEVGARLVAAEAVQREIEQIRTEAAAAAVLDTEGRLAHCQALGRTLDTVVARLADMGPQPDPREVAHSEFSLLLDDTGEIPYDVARLEAIASALATVTGGGGGESPA